MNPTSSLLTSRLATVSSMLSMLSSYHPLMRNLKRFQRRRCPCLSAKELLTLQLAILTFLPWLPLLLLLVWLMHSQETGHSLYLVRVSCCHYYMCIYIFHINVNITFVLTTLYIFLTTYSPNQRGFCSSSWRNCWISPPTWESAAAYRYSYIPCGCRWSP